MTRIPVIRFILLAISLTLSGCMSDRFGKNTPDISERVVDTKLNSAIEDLRQSSGKPSSNSKLFSRQLSLSFQEADKNLTIRHKQIIELFFQTIPREKKLDIVISVAPASGREKFQSLQDAWKRLRSLEQQISPYSTNIELIYQPELDPDTALLQVVGGNGV